MEKLHVPGSVISIVKDGQMIFTKGYGVSDIENHTPVVPDETFFRIGTIEAPADLFFLIGNTWY